MSLTDGEQTFVTEWVAAMEAGSGGDKYAVSELQAKAIIKLIKSGDLNISTPAGLAAGPYPVSGSAPNAGGVI